jgi:tRNA(Ile)-lysidine synthase
MAREAGADLVLLAQHRRDQAETVLLQALRGGGVAALSAMPRQVVREGITWARPWLDAPRESIDAYVRRHRLRFIDDASNVDPRFARSRLRKAVWPALAAAFPEAEAALAASARRAQQESAALAELAAMDLAAVGDDEGSALDLVRWSALSVPRRALVLRAWLLQHQGRGADDSLVSRLLDEASIAMRPATWPAGGGRVRRYRGRLLWTPAGAPADTSSLPAHHLAIDRPGRHDAGPWGAFDVTVVAEGGVPPALLRHVELRPRAGAEQFQARPNATPRSLKKQFQSAAVPAWAREGPLVFAGGQLLYVPGLGLDARRLAPPGAEQWQLAWVRPAAP